MCLMSSFLSCGSDGKLYNNGCQMMRKNCGKHVYEVPAPFCLNKLYRYIHGVTNAPSNDVMVMLLSCFHFSLSPLHHTNRRTKCPVDCSGETSKPVCGSDGQLYANRSAETWSPRSC